MYRKQISGTQESPLRKIKAMSDQDYMNRTYVDVSDTIAEKCERLRRYFDGSEAEFNRLIFTFGLDDFERFIKLRIDTIQR